MTATELVDVMPAPARPRVIIPRGLPGSGKSTLYARMHADNPALARVSRDDLRATLFGGEGVLSHEQEWLITKVMSSQAAELLDAGWDVYVDAMNIRLRGAREWANFAVLHGADFEAIILDTPVDECVRRDAARGASGGRSLGEDRIRELARKYPRQNWGTVEASPDLRFYPEPYVSDESLPPVWLCDIDGTVARMTGRDPYDLTRVHEDVPIEHTATILRKLAVDSSIIMLSGRSENSREVTLAWLRDNDIPFHSLLMRADGDGRPDFLVKSRLFDEHIRDHYHVLGVFDDRLSVCRMWERLGVPLMRLGVPDADDF